LHSLSSFNERQLGASVEWSAIDPALALRTPRVLECLREACLIESFLPVFTSRMCELFWDDVDATSVFTIEAFEAYGHYYLLRRYLEAVGRETVSDADVVRVRANDRERVYSDKIGELVNFMATEHFAAAFFSQLAAMTEEPVLKELLPRLAREEVRHAQFAFDLLEARIEANPELCDVVLERARNFTHVGAYVLPRVSPAGDDNLESIARFNDMVGRLVGRRLSDAQGVEARRS
jgi:hypothetical protein